jgi:hypothetical protein
LLLLNSWDSGGPNQLLQVWAHKLGLVRRTLLSWTIFESAAPPFLRQRRTNQLLQVPYEFISLARWGGFFYPGPLGILLLLHSGDRGGPNQLLQVYELINLAWRAGLLHCGPPWESAVPLMWQGRTKLVTSGIS